MNDELNKVIIIGTDHHNVLGTVRCFGVNNINPYGIIVKNDDSPLWVIKSRYWAKTWVTDSDKNIYDILIANFSNEKKKPVVICCSDGAMSYVDSNLDKLSEKFILPSLNREQGAITRLMNKEIQSEFLYQNGIKTLESKIINLADNLNENTFEYPIILKPVASIEGDKKDITICHNYNELKKAFNELISAGYERVLVQPYVSKITEYHLTGSVSGHSISFTASKNIRQWPTKTGSGSYSCFVNSGQILDFSEKVLQKLQTVGFSGPIDIELFEINQQFYVNEINWRSSGRVYVNLYNRIYSTYYYYLDVSGIDYNKYSKKKTGYAINETADIRNAIFSKNVSFPKWIIQLFRSKCYALWFSNDLKPTLSRYKYYIKKFMSKKE